MNYAALRNKILNDPELSALAVTNDMPKENPYLKDKAITDALNAEAGVRIVETRITDLDIMAKIGITAGSAILDKLTAAAAGSTALARAMKALESERGIDISHVQTVGMLTQLVTAGVLLEAEKAALTALAEQPSSRALDLLGHPVSIDAVSIALRGNFEYTPGA